MPTMTLAISGTTCGHRVSSVRAARDSLPGVAVEAVRIGSDCRTPAAATPTRLAAR